MWLDSYYNINILWQNIIVKRNKWTINTTSKINRVTTEQLIQQIEKEEKYYSRICNAKTKPVTLVLLT